MTELAKALEISEPALHNLMTVLSIKPVQDAANPSVRVS
jgi:hypothetical protein